MLSVCWNGNPDRLDNEFYVIGTDKYKKYLLNNYLKNNKIAGNNIFFDRYFTRVTVTNWCKEKRFPIVGTMRKYKKEIPTNIKALENRKEKSTKFYYSEDNKMLLTSYFDKKA